MILCVFWSALQIWNQKELAGIKLIQKTAINATTEIKTGVEFECCGKNKSVYITAATTLNVWYMYLWKPLFFLNISFETITCENLI